MKVDADPHIAVGLESMRGRLTSAHRKDLSSHWGATAGGKSSW